MNKKILHVYINLIKNGEYDKDVKKYSKMIQALKKQIGDGGLSEEDIHEIEKAWIERQKEIGIFN